MRIVHIKELQAKRHAEYNPDFHGIIDQRLNFQFRLLEAEQGRMKLEAKFVVEFQTRQDQQKFATVDGVAEIVVKSEGIEKKPDGSLDVSPGVQAVIDGALSDEIMLPLSILARQMKLPSIVRLTNLKAEPEAKEPTPNVAR
jgi:hypothetical protein